MNSVFVDSVGLLAIIDKSDQWHPPSIVAYNQLLHDNRNLITTSFVLTECGNAASRRPYRRVVFQAREQFELMGNLMLPTPDDWDSAWVEYRQSPIYGPSIVDCISFQVMRRLGLTEVFSNDQHFANAGFTLLF
jgi:uncharacterized protein